MPGFKDFVNLATLLETDMDDLLMKQTTMKFASVAARTAALTGFFREGLVSILDDLNTIGINTGATDVWSTIGPVHGALTAWTPAVVQLGSVTVTNTYSRYMRIGRLITCFFNLSVTGSGTANNSVTISLPFTAQTSTLVVGSAELNDVSATLKYEAMVYLVSTTTVDFRGANTTVNDNRLGMTGAPFQLGLASGDVITGTFTYEAAADA